MSLQVYISLRGNPDADDDESGRWMDFWAAFQTQQRLTNPSDPTLSEAEEADQIRLLIEDKHRVHRLREELDRLMPNRKERNARELRQAMNKIERELKRILGNQVKYTPEPA